MFLVFYALFIVTCLCTSLLKIILGHTRYQIFQLQIWLQSHVVSWPLLFLQWWFFARIKDYWTVNALGLVHCFSYNILAVFVHALASWNTRSSLPQSLATYTSIFEFQEIINLQTTCVKIIQSELCIQNVTKQNSNTVYVVFIHQLLEVHGSSDVRDIPIYWYIDIKFTIVIAI